MKLDKDITVIDDFIDEEYQEEIKNILIGNSDFLWEGEEFPFDWYFISDVTFPLTTFLYGLSIYPNLFTLQ